MSFTFGSKRIFLNQPAILVVFWLAFPLILLIYLPPAWEWIAVAVSVAAGFLFTLRIEDASVISILEKSNRDGDPMFRDHSGRKILGFGPESLAVFNAHPDALKAWQAGWEGWKDLEEKHGASFFHWNGFQELLGGNPVSQMMFRFENEKKLLWSPASCMDRELTVNAAARFSPFPLKREELQVNGFSLKPMHLALAPMIILSVMVFLIGIGLVPPMDASKLADEKNPQSPLFLITWEMSHQVQNWVPKEYFSELAILVLGLVLWFGLYFSRRQHKELALRVQVEQ